MVKTTYALTLFAAVSLAAPVAQLNGRSEQQGSVEHKNLIEDIPIIGTMLAGKQETKRDEAQPQHHNVIDDLPVIGGLLGNNKENQRRDIGRDGISGLPLVGNLFGKHTHTGGENGMNKRQSFGQNHGQNAGMNAGQNEGQNYGQNAGQNAGQNHGQNHGQNAGQNGGKNWKRDIESSLSSLPIVGDLLGKNQDKPSHQQTETPAKHLDNRDAGHSQGVFGILQSLTSGSPVSKSHKRDESAAPKANEGQQGNQKGAENQEAKESESSGGLLGGLMGENGLGGLKGNSEHGVGLLPMRRDAKELEARQAPIQGSTLTGVLLEGGALGKVTNFLSGGAMPKPGSSSPTDMGDGSTSGPPDPASGAGPHSGPGLAAEQQQQGSGDASE
ncbi:hypothetical protein PENSOL_c034G10362 [Penicillium solitum]|uniref:Uncharacterized protein n=1 Tax=Penicillium solitum TaxID=60172 RepID=A0A1V6QVE3_9EURO|nr:uncharacterized protein PENSOL_c034G10362 [Penicillium solitum]OQD93184.1 hypothetical protein PENSOL_c034G10362 [Penicillium solitum]